MSRRAVLALLAGLAAFAGAAAGVRAAEPAGDAARGRALFAQRQCARCHLPLEQGPGTGPALETVRSPQGALELSGRLWSHAPAMAAAFEREGIGWPRLSPQDEADLLAYLQADPARDAAPDLFRGQVTLVRKGCLKCHRLRGEGGEVAPDLTAYGDRYASAVDWAAAVWNHAPRMAGVAARLEVLYPRFSGDEMAHLVGFLRRAAAEGR